MADYAKWKYGAVNLPLPTSTSNSLLLDSDPAIYYTLDYFSSVIRTYVEPRLLTAVAVAPVITQIAQSIAMVVPYDPTPYLTETQFQFPLLAIYRVKGKFEDKTIAWLHRMGEWQLKYILPPMNAGQVERIQPIFNAVALTLHDRVETLFDPGYQSSLAVWQAAGIEAIFLGEETYGRFEGGGDLTFPTWSCTLSVRERLGFVAGELSTLGGVDIGGIDLASPNQPPVTDFIDAGTTFIDPTTIPTIACVWVPDNATTSDGTHVASITCPVSGNTQTQPTLANQPTIAPAVLTDFAGNKKNAIRFDGVSSFMTATVSALANDSSRTIVALIRLSNTTQRSSLVAQTLNGDTGAHSLAIEANTVGSAGGLFGFFGGGSSYDTPAVTNMLWHVLSVTITATTNGSTISSSTVVQVDGSIAQALTLKGGAGTWQGMSTANLIALGAIPGVAGTNAAADVGPVLVFNSALTSAQLQSAITYCKQWGGLT